jgi:hypothetical protein
VEDAKRIAVAGYRQVLEDGKDICSSESDAEYSDHGEELTGMYTPDIIGHDGRPNLASARLTAEEGECAARCREDTGSGATEAEMREDQKRLVRRFSKPKKSAKRGAGGQATGSETPDWMNASFFFRFYSSRSSSTALRQRLSPVAGLLS